MDLEVYIGDLSDPRFKWENGDYDGNIPKRISMFFPQPHKLFFHIVDQIEERKIEGKKTDWGSWTAVLYPKQILEIAKEYYKDDLDHQLKNYIQNLDQNKKYALVACEMS